MASLGGYGAVDGSASMPGTTPDGRDHIDISNTLSAGTLTDFTIWLSLIASGVTFKLKVWRDNGTNYDFVGQSQAIDPVGLSVGAHSFELDTPITVQSGDYIGVWMAGTGTRGDMFSDAGSSVIYDGTSADNTTNTAKTEFNGTYSDRSICIECFDNANSITLTSPIQYQTFQRSGTTGNISIAGTYLGSPTSIEASFAGGDYEEIDGSPSGNAFSATMSVPQGQGTLTVRFSNDTGINDSVTDVGVGDVFIIIGDSNAEGRATNPQSYTHATLKSTAFNQDDEWIDGNDPIDTGAVNGSVWPLLATLIMGDQGVPVSFITVGTGGTDCYGDSTQWQKGNASYTELTNQVAACGLSSFKAVLSHMGPNVVLDETGTATVSGYLTALQTLASNLAADFGVSAFYIPQLGEVTYSGSPPDRITAINNVRAAQLASWGTGIIKRGPVLFDITTDDGAHYKSDASLAILANRWFASIKSRSYGTYADTSPTISGATINKDRTEIRVKFNVPVLPLVGGNAEGFSVRLDGTSKTILSESVLSADTILLTVAALDSGVVTVSLGYGNDGAGDSVPIMSDTYNLPAASFTGVVATTIQSTTIKNFIGSGIHSSWRL